MIHSIIEAFDILDTQRNGIPFEAIEYLYEHVATPAITEKIIFALKNAYNDTIYYDDENDFYYNTPLWYAIVAENHVSKELIEPVVSLFTNEEVQEWDLLSEQGGFLLGKLCNFPYWTVPRIFDKIEELAQLGSTAPYYWLYGIIRCANYEEYYRRIVDIFKHPLLHLPEVYATFFVERYLFKHAIPIIKERIEKLVQNKFTKEEAKHFTSETQNKLVRVLWQLENDVRIAYPAEPNLIQYFRLGEWKSYYKELEENFK